MQLYPHGMDGNGVKHPAIFARRRRRRNLSGRMLVLLGAYRAA